MAEAAAVEAAAAPVKRGDQGTTYFENQDEAFCGIHAINMLFQERKVVWFPGCPIYILRDQVAAVDTAYDAWTDARTIEQHAFAEYIETNGETLKPSKSTNPGEKKLLNAAFKDAKSGDQKFERVMTLTDRKESSAKKAAFAPGATADAIRAWVAMDAASEAIEIANLEAAEAALVEATKANAADVVAAYKVTVAERNVWWQRYVLSRRRTQRSRFQMVQAGIHAEAPGATDATDPNVLFNVASYCSDSWATDQRVIFIQMQVADEAENVVRRQTGPVPDPADESYGPFMIERKKYQRAGVNTADRAAVLQYLIDDALAQQVDDDEADMCTLEEQGSDGNLPAPLIEHIMWQEFRYQVIPVYSDQVPQHTWAAEVREKIEYGGALGLIVNYPHPEVANHYCAVIKFPNAPDPERPYAIGDSILLHYPPQTIITYYTLDEVMAQIETINPNHVSCVFAQVPNRASTVSLQRMIEAGQDVDDDAANEDAAAAANEDAANEDAASPVAADAAGLQAPASPSSGGARKTRRASKARRNKSSRR